MNRFVRWPLCLAAAILPLLGMAQESVLYREDFSLFVVNQCPAGFTEKGVVKEENGHKYLSCSGGFGFLLNPKLMKFMGAHKWRHLEVSFRFRFTDPTKLGFSLVVKSGGWRPAGVKYDWYYVGIRPDSVDAVPMNSTAGKDEIERATLKKVLLADKGLSPLQAGQWYSAKAVVRDSTLELFMEKDGQMVRLLSGEVFPGGGAIDWLSYNAVDLADILVIEPSVAKE